MEVHRSKMEVDRKMEETLLAKVSLNFLNFFEVKLFEHNIAYSKLIN